ncbi:MAG: hypothetical protein VX726_08600 [Planctomycetota bacterium]|nr:hypothetical protein [Planctomycetota bacterium]
MRSIASDGPARRGLTITEILAVIGIIIVLLAILLPGLSTVRRTGQQATSENNLKQVFTVMKSYMTDNREFIPPSSFDYRDEELFSFPGTVRTNSPRNAAPNMAPVEGGRFEPGSPQHVGSWADILWTFSDQDPILDVAGPNTLGGTEYNYRYDSPDRWVYRSVPEYKTMFRSTAENTRAVDGTAATPFGSGTVAEEKGQPGYFAANDWFSVGPDGGRWFTNQQIRFPDRSVYLVDSYAGETIAPTIRGWGGGGFQGQVDFRYVGDNALLMTLDGGIRTESTFSTIDDIIERGYRIHDLDQRSPGPLPPPAP